MGLECLSRGAAHAAFFEADRSALERLKKNIGAVQVGSRSELVAGDLFKWFSANAPSQPADLIFLDPPYRFLKEHPDKLQTLAQAIAKDHLAADGLVIFRHDVQDELELPPLKKMDRRQYGSMLLEFLSPK
jgi:16S rRNA (guanine966-N2)-methyltransferase